MEQLPSKVEKRPLPKIEDLYNDVDLAGKHNELNRLLNCEPRKEWVQVNKYAGNSKYIPVGIIEYLLTSIFIKWRTEVKQVQVIANSVVVTVRLFVLDPITGEWDWNDGVGASPIQTAAGAAATDFTKVNTSAVQMSAPAAETYAVKDAAEKFGKIFGKDLNRKEEMNYAPMMEGRFASHKETAEEKENARIEQYIRNATSIEQLDTIYDKVKDIHIDLFLKRKEELGKRKKAHA